MKKINNNKIIFMGTPLVASNYLRILLENNYNIISVFTQPARKKNRGLKTQISEVEQVAKQNNILIHSPEKFDEKSCELIKSYKADLIIVIAYGLIIPAYFLNIAKFGFINVHFSLLPHWRGAAPIEHTLLNGDKKTGVSIIKLTEKLDAGPILSQKEVLIEDGDNKEKLYDKLYKIGSNQLIEVLPRLFSKKINLKNQDEKQATFANKITSLMRKINFNSPSSKVINQIRAYSPKPSAWFTYKKERIKIIRAIRDNKTGAPGTILSDKFELGCIDGCVAPLYLQREGKKIIHIDDFLRGFSFKIGNKLNE